jgi:hypothetical protein
MVKEDSELNAGDFEMLRFTQDVFESDVGPMEIVYLIHFDNKGHHLRSFATNAEFTIAF